MVSIERAGRIVVAMISRAPVNAFNGELVARLDGVLDQVAGDEEVSELHVRSDQKAFCAGADHALIDVTGIKGDPGKSSPYRQQK